MAILWDDRINVGDLTISAYLHGSGHHSVSFSRYGEPHFDVGFMFDAEHVDAMIGLLQKLRDEGRAAEARAAQVKAALLAAQDDQSEEAD